MLLLNLKKKKNMPPQFHAQDKQFVCKYTHVHDRKTLWLVTERYCIMVMLSRLWSFKKKSKLKLKILNWSLEWKWKFKNLSILLRKFYLCLRQTRGQLKDVSRLQAALKVNFKIWTTTRLHLKQNWTDADSCQSWNPLFYLLVYIFFFFFSNFQL